MPISRRKRILRAIIKGKVRDAFLQNTYERLEDSAQDVTGELEGARSKNSSNSSSKDFCRSRSGSGHGSKEFSRSRSSSGSSKYSSSSSSRRSRQVIILDPRMLKRSESINPHEFSRSTSGSGSSRYNISSGSSRDLTRSRSNSGPRHALNVVGLGNRLLKRSDPINVKRDRFLKRTDSLVPKKYHVQLGISSSNSPPLTREDSFGGLNWSRPSPNMKLKHVDSLIIISAKVQPGNPVRSHDVDKAYAEITKHRSFKRIDTLRTFKRVDSTGTRALRRLESIRSIRAMQPQKRLKRSKNILRKARLWKSGRGVRVRFHLSLGRCGPRRPRDCYIRAMLKAAEDHVSNNAAETTGVFDETPRIFKFGPIHVNEIEEEVGFCRNVMLVYHRSISSLC